MLALSFALGAILGLFYFYGLWFTLRRLPGSKQPALLSLGSFLGRSAICILGFYLILGSGLEALISSVIGFILVKVVLINRLALEGRSNG
ncbi:MAG: ATP synthase subunit I [Methanotrichaceae archaeon]